MQEDHFQEPEGAPRPPPRPPRGARRVVSLPMGAVDDSILEGEDLFFKLAAASFEGTVLHAGGEIVFANRVIGDLLGYEAEELIGMQADELVAPEYRAVLRENIRRGYTEPYEVVGLRRDGTRLWGELRGKPIVIDGRPMRIAAIRDITYRKQHIEELAREVAERRLAEERLMREKERLRLLIEQIPALVWSTDEKLRVTAIEGSGLAPLQLSPQAEIEVGLFRLLQGLDASHSIIAPQLRALEGESVSYDGAWQGRTYEIRIDPFRDEGGKIVGTVGVALDNTERRRTEDELRLVQSIILAMAEVESVGAALEAAIEKVCHVTGWAFGQAWVPRSGDGMVACSRCTVNPGGLEGFIAKSQQISFAPGEGFIGKVWAERKPLWVADLSASAEFYRRAEAAAAGVKAGLFVPVMADGDVIAILEFFVLERRLEDERLIRLVSAVAAPLGSFLLRKQIEAERKRLLDEQEVLTAAADRVAAQLQGVLDNMLDIVAVCDAGGRLTIMNRQALQLAGRQGIDEPGILLSELLDELDVRTVNGKKMSAEDSPYAAALRGTNVVNQDVTLYSPTRRCDVTLRVNASPIYGTDGIVGAVAVARDYTAQREFELMKDQFFRVTAHELKTPLAIMKGYSELILRSVGELPDPQRKMLLNIDRGADRIVRIINDLLDIARFGRIEFDVSHTEPLRLDELVGEAVERAASTTQKHRLRIVASEPVLVLADGDRIEQVLGNLLQNAIKYSPRGGDIDVSLKRTGAGEALVSVRDQGVGIPAKKQEKIFQRFYRAHTDTPNDYGGMGVGLHISNEIVRKHGGRMGFESVEGRGSTFWFSLPVAPTRELPQREGSPPGGQ